MVSTHLKNISQIGNLSQKIFETTNQRIIERNILTKDPPPVPLAKLKCFDNDSYESVPRKNLRSCHQQAGYMEIHELKQTTCIAWRYSSKMVKNIDLSFIHINDKIHQKKHYLYLNMIYRDTVHWPSLLWKKLTLKYSFCTSDVLLKNTSFAAESNILVLAWGCLLTPDVQGIPFPFFFQFQGSPIPSYPFQPPTLSFRFPVLCPHCKPQSCQKRAQNMAEFDSYWIVSWCAIRTATREPDCPFVQQPLSQQTYDDVCWYSRMSACSQKHGMVSDHQTSQMPGVHCTFPKNGCIYCCRI